MSESHLIARQPICNAGLKVVAFELLYRMSGKENNAIIVDDDMATIDVLLAAYNDLSISDVVGKQKAFINFTSNIIINKLPPLPPKQLVIELLEGQKVTPDLIKALKTLRKKGYQIALDDFCLNQETLSLIECADIIKLDVLDQAPETWAKYIPKLTERGITMLAEKVETYEIYEQCKALGFTLFQGYFFSKPKILLGKTLSRNEMSVINLLNKLNSPEVNYDEVVKLISADVGLSYNLLRTVNSGMYSLSRTVDSVRQAAVTLGINHLKNWINLLALGTLDNKPQILIDTAMIRAKMCELIGEAISQKESAEEYFTVGLFSIIDAFFDTPLAELIKKLSLNKTMTDALLSKKGLMGKTLTVVIQYQEGSLDTETMALLSEHHIDAQKLNAYYFSSLAWTEENKST
jgi:c-di-GMP phosphodiesterase